MKAKKCQKCGNILSDVEGATCLFCEKGEDSEEKKQSNDDKRRWLDREQEEDW